MPLYCVLNSFETKEYLSKFIFFRQFKISEDIISIKSEITLSDALHILLKNINPAKCITPTECSKRFTLFDG